MLDLVLLSVWCVRFVVHFQQQLCIIWGGGVLFDEGSSILLGRGSWGGGGGRVLCCLCSYCNNIFDLRVSFGQRVNRLV